MSVVDCWPGEAPDVGENIDILVGVFSGENIWLDFDMIEILPKAFARVLISLSLSVITSFSSWDSYSLSSDSSSSSSDSTNSSSASWVVA